MPDGKLSLLHEKTLKAGNIVPGRTIHVGSVDLLANVLQESQCFPRTFSLRAQFAQAPVHFLSLLFVPILKIPVQFMQFLYALLLVELFLIF